MTVDIFQLTQTALNTLTGVPSGVDVQLDEHGNYPDLYLVYALVTGTPAQHADNAETERFFRVQVSFYFRGDVTTLPDVKEAMLAAGFLEADWRLLPYNEDSRHHGLAKDYTILLNQ